jgi:hypothetical protein
MVAPRSFPTDHIAPGDAIPESSRPLTAVEPVRRLTAAEEARTLVANSTVATLATLSADGHPWGSLVTYGALRDGSPVLCVSVLAEHGRNLLEDARASLVITTTSTPEDPLAAGRVTLAGRATQPTGDLEHEARDAHVKAHPAAAVYAGFGDFSIWVLEVERVRWVGGYGRMDSADADSYREAEADPVAPQAAYAIAHLNADHADALLVMGQTLGGFPDATRAGCTAADRYGLDLRLDTPRGRASARVGFAETVTAPDGLRSATVELARRARSAGA